MFPPGRLKLVTRPSLIGSRASLAAAASMSPTSVSAASARSSADGLAERDAEHKREADRVAQLLRGSTTEAGRSQRAPCHLKGSRVHHTARASRPLSSGRAVPFAREPYNQRRKPAAPTPWGAAGSAEPKRRARKGLFALGPSSSRPRPRCHRRAPGPPSHEANELAHRQRLSRERPRGLRLGVGLFGVLGLGQRARRPYARPIASRNGTQYSEMLCAPISACK
jgi:hypothetical protein